MREVVVDGSPLTIGDVVAVAHGKAQASLGADVPRLMETSRSVIVKALSGGAPVYGVNTGFGALADTPVGEADLTTLQGAIVRSHAAGIGVPLDDEVVRAILLLRARTLAAGYSGQSLERIRKLGLEKTAQIVNGDILKQDYSSADLITVYLLPNSNDKEIGRGSC